MTNIFQRGGPTTNHYIISVGSPQTIPVGRFQPISVRLYFYIFLGWVTLGMLYNQTVSQWLFHIDVAKSPFNHSRSPLNHNKSLLITIKSPLNHHKSPLNHESETRTHPGPSAPRGPLLTLPGTWRHPCSASGRRDHHRCPFPAAKWSGHSSGTWDIAVLS